MICEAALYEQPVGMWKVELTDVGADFSDTDVVRAIETRNCRRLLYLIRTGAVEVNRRDELTGGSYLHRIVENCRTVPSSDEMRAVPLVYALSNAGIDMDAVDSRGNTALRMSIKYRLLDIMVACLKAGASADQNEEELIAKHTVLFSYEFFNWFKKLVPGYWQAVEENNAFRVNKLVKSWCRINVERRNESLLEFAKRINAKRKIVDLLEQNEASIDFAHATIAGDEERMKFLLCNRSVSLNTVDYSHRKDIFSQLTPFSLRETALAYGHHHVMPLLGDRTFEKRSRQTKPSSICAIT